MAPVADRINLDEHRSDCGDKQKEIVSRDKKHPYKHTGINDSGGRVRHYLIDGGVLPKGQKPERCDFLLLTDDTDPPAAYFIELKGSLSDADKCRTQVENTERMCEDSIKGYRRLYRFVFGKGHGNYSSAFVAWRNKQKKGKVIAQRGDIKDRF